MNLSTKQKPTHRRRERTGGCQGGGAGEEKIGNLRLAGTYTIYRMDKQQGPTAQHRELYSLSWDKPRQKKI